MRDECDTKKLSRAREENTLGHILNRRYQFLLSLSFRLKELRLRVNNASEMLKSEFIPYKVGTLTLFFGDITLHGVHECTDGDRISLSVNLSQISLAEFKGKYNPSYLT